MMGLELFHSYATDPLPRNLLLGLGLPFRTVNPLIKFPIKGKNPEDIFFLEANTFPARNQSRKRIKPFDWWSEVDPRFNYNRTKQGILFWFRW